MRQSWYTDFFRLQYREKVGLSFHWLKGDIANTELQPCSYDVWHDRAVFHFLTATDARVSYVRQVAKVVKAGGHVIISTFGQRVQPKAPVLTWSGYNAESRHEEFGVRFQLPGNSTELYQVPFGTTQQFLYWFCRMERSTIPVPATSWLPFTRRTKL
jgi:hypothetical protein